VTLLCKLCTGFNRFSDDIAMMIGHRPNYYWIICWVALTPIMTWVINYILRRFFSFFQRPTFLIIIDKSNKTELCPWPCQISQTEKLHVSRQSKLEKTIGASRTTRDQHGHSRQQYQLHGRGITDMRSTYVLSTLGPSGLSQL